MMELVIIVAVLALLAFWCYQFIFLMMIEDDLFPGKLDKAIWAAVFIFVAPLAPFVFRLWRRAIVTSVKAGDKSGSQHQRGG